MSRGNQLKMENGSIRQVLAALIGSFAMMNAGVTFYWVTPLLPLFKSENSVIPMTKTQLDWMVSLVEAGDICGTLPTGWFADRFGRKTSLLATAPLLLVTWIEVLRATSVYELYVTRFLQGFIMGAIFTLCPMYLAEIPHSKIRGFCSVSIQIMWFMGIFYNNGFGPRLDFSTFTYVCIIPSVVFFLAFLPCPESPHFYRLAGKIEDAKRIEAWLHGYQYSTVSTMEINPIGYTVMAEKKCEEEEITHTMNSGQLLNTLKNYKKIFSTKRQRKALLIVMVSAASNVLGVPAFLTYSEVTFRDIAPRWAYHCNLLLPVITLACTIVSSALTALFRAFSSKYQPVLVDILGRRPLLLGSTFLAAICLFTAAAAPREFAAIPLLLYPGAIALGPGSLGVTIQGELFPNKLRAVACSLIALMISILTFISLILYQNIEENLGRSAIFLLLGFVCTGTFFFLAYLMPETKGKTFEEIQELL